MAKRPEPARQVERDELLEVVRETIRTSPGLTNTDFKKKLPKPYQPHLQAALTLARELVANGEVHGWSKGKKERFFSSDPVETLERAVFGILARGPLSQAALKQELKTAFPTLLDHFAVWWKGALGGGRIFEQLSAVPKTKLFGTKADARLLLKKQLDELRKTLPSLDKTGLSRHEIAAAFLEVLGVTTGDAPRGVPVPSASDSSDRTAVLDALKSLARQNPGGALLPIRELRGAARLSKERFDATALLLEKEGTVTLHYHDHAASLSAAERSELVLDERGTYYTGIAFRRGT